MPAGGSHLALSEAARIRALELEDSWGLAGRLVPAGSSCVVADCAPARERRSEPRLANVFLSSHRMASRSRRETIIYSVVVHAFLLAFVLMLPLWFSDSLNSPTFLTTILTAPPQFSSATPLTAALPARATAAAQPVRRSTFMSGGKLLVPTAIPKHAAIVHETVLEPDLPAGIGAYGGLAEGLGTELFGAAAEAAPPPPPLPTEPAAVLEQPKLKRPLEVGGKIQPPKLVHQVDPIYPKLAKLSRIEGDVVLSAIIDEHGEVTELKIISGPPLLYVAALDAVRQWKFEPTYLNGQPRAVIHEITVHFQI